MKIIKTASGHKVKISKKEWEQIGKTAAWDDVVRDVASVLPSDPNADLLNPHNPNVDKKREEIKQEKRREQGLPPAPAANPQQTGQTGQPQQQTSIFDSVEGTLGEFKVGDPVTFNPQIANNAASNGTIESFNVSAGTATIRLPDNNILEMNVTELVKANV